MAIKAFKPNLSLPLPTVNGIEVMVSNNLKFNFMLMKRSELENIRMTELSDDDAPQLSLETLRALQEFYDEQVLKEAKQNCNEATDIVIDEDWQLSQFWYDNSTVRTLTNAVCKLLEPNAKIALISCPTLYKKLKDNLNGTVHLFEYDRRFAAIGSDFNFYDYNHPLEIEKQYENQFDLVIADPPFLSEECIEKTAVSIKFLAKHNIILCTGAVMADLAEKILNLKKCSFVPKHKNNLANEFCCYSNFDLDNFM